MNSINRFTFSDIQFQNHSQDRYCNKSDEKNAFLRYFNVTNVHTRAWRHGEQRRHFYNLIKKRTLRKCFLLLHTLTARGTKNQPRLDYSFEHFSHFVCHDQSRAWTRTLFLLTLSVPKNNVSKSWWLLKFSMTFRYLGAGRVKINIFLKWKPVL